MSRARIVIVGLIGLAGSISVIAYVMYNKPHRNIADEQTKYELTSDELYDDYESDEAGANYKYLDAVVEVIGKIESIDEDMNGRQVLTLTASNAMLGGVSATLLEKQSTHKEGEEVHIKCRCTGKLLDVVLVDCSLITP